ncbi:pitrilysin family protein [Pseudoflavonifractor capillosus]|uniref:Insulinase family protein n=1 Tax=Pseudoflavonifractor capillosus TaxID=106588 RepID=A0A921MNW1_9FIRM|nr:pitrilysin family protein [Pseudoflavonifractor capillosus]HJG87765.1 insulinase family protein [Pseudoflavonifractor capillosus]
MTEVTRTELLPGVYLTAVHTMKFKSSYMGIQLLTPLRAEHAAANALIPMVLRRGTERCPDMESLSAALDELYGGAVEPIVRKKGETQCVGFVASFLDDAYVPDGTPILECAAALLGEMLLTPARENGGFVSAYVERERANLVDRIRAQVNDKRQYAVLRLVQLMCQGEPYGVDRLGSEAKAAAITGEELWARYQDLLSGARVELYFSGSAPFERVEAAFRGALAGLKGRTADTVSVCRNTLGGGEECPRSFEDALDVTQGKLAMGLRTDIKVTDAEYPALMLFNAVFGGTTTSKLFLNVREKLSLCYYASSQVEKFKGLMLVSSGVEFDKREAAQSEILAQLEKCRRGEMEPWELEAARRSSVSGLRSLLDSQGRMEDFRLGLAVGGGDGPEDLAAKLEQVTADQVAAAARRVRLDSIYFLKGKEEHQ